MGIIHECGGKMHMAERQWAEAATDFFEAFKNYDEAGNPRRIQCLKCASPMGFLLFLILASLVIFYMKLLIRYLQHIRYLVLANMLMESVVNPFDGQEAKP